MAKRAQGKVASSAEKDGVVWTRRQREQVFGSPRPLPIDAAPPDSDAAWSSLCELYGRPELYKAPKEADRKLEPVLAELRKQMLGGACPTETTLEREHLRAALLLNEGMVAAERNKRELVAAALVPFCAGVGGLPFAAQVVWSVPAHATSEVSCGEARRVYGAGKATSPATLGTSDELWWLHLRRQVLAAPAAEYDAAWKACRAAKAGAVATAATFCRCPDEAHRLAETHLGQPGWGSLPLLSAIANPSLALAFARTHADFAIAATNHAFHLADNLGKAAAPTLLALLEAAASKTETRKALAAAAALSDPDLCRATVVRLEGPAKTALGAALKG